MGYLSNALWVYCAHNPNLVKNRNYSYVKNDSKIRWQFCICQNSADFYKFVAGLDRNNKKAKWILTKLSLWDHKMFFKVDPCISWDFHILIMLILFWAQFNDVMVEVSGDFADAVYFCSSYDGACTRGRAWIPSFKSNYLYIFSVFRWW